MESINGSDVLLHELSTSHPTHVPPPPPPPPPPREKNKRPQLSCNPCRARKVKCDRIQPCSACSLHQIADICHYDLSEAERQPILQAEALKEKDRTILSLKDEIASLRGESLKSDFDERGGTSQKLRLPPRSPRKASLEAPQRRFQGQENDQLLLGESGVMHIADDFDHLSFDRGPSTASRQQQHSVDLPSFQTANSYPFPTLWTAKDDTSSLIRILPPGQDLFFYLESFQRRSILFSYPMLPEEVTEGEVRKFLQNLEHNAALYPDYLALLFATLALGLHDGVFDKLGEKWAAGSMEAESKKGDVYIAAAMQCLRLAAFTNRPTLLAIQALSMMTPYLTYSGNFLDASALFALTVRLAQAIGLYRDPSQLNISISPKEMTTRRTLWWWMMYVDQQYCITLGKPSAISNVGDCPAPEVLLQEPVLQSIRDHMVQFTIVAREILSSPQLQHNRIDEGTDQLLMIQKSLHPVVQFDVTWLNRDRPLVGWPHDVQAAILHAKVHNLVISLNRRRIETEHGLEAVGVSHLPEDRDIEGVPRGRPRVLESCRALLQSFEFFHSRLRAGMGSWTMGQMAFNASMLLTLSMLETGETQDLLPVQHAYSTFLEMNKLGIHKLAGAAVERLGRLMKEFGTDDSANEKVMGCGGMLLLEDPGSHKLVPEGPKSGPGTNNSPDKAKTSSTPSQRSKLSQQRRRQAKRATTFRDAGVSKSRRNSLSKGQRPLADRRFSDSMTPRSSQRRRMNRSTPNLSLLTTLSDHEIFSATSTPAVKSETLFTPSASAFDGLPHTAFPLSGPDSMTDTHHGMNDITETSGQGFPMTTPQQSQTQFLAQNPQDESHMQQNNEQMQHQEQSNGLHVQTMQASMQSDQQNFDFSSNSTPYSSEFFDGNMSAVVGNQTFDEQNLNFEHPQFSSAPPFSMPQTFAAGQY